LGHNYSIFLKFRGGAGAVTALGALAALNFPVALIGSMVAIGAIVITRYASVGSFLGNLTGLLMLIVFAGLGITPWDYILYGILAVAIIGWSLRPNFTHIREGTERKIGVPENNIKHI
jgi:glycerol-3-phosphate acyltransferase PlsY